MVKSSEPQGCYQHSSGSNHNPNLSVEVQIMLIQEFTPEELETEEWRDVSGYEGVYSVSVSYVKQASALLAAISPKGFVPEPAIWSALVAHKYSKSATFPPRSHMGLLSNRNRVISSVQAALCRLRLSPVVLCLTCADISEAASCTLATCGAAGVLIF